jgi:hypothetical protein
MTPAEARLALTVRRANGMDDSNAMITAALLRAREDTDLRVWCERQQAFDRGVAAALRAVAPPGGLRESILSGTGGRRGVRFARVAAVWGIAAGLALMAGFLGSRSAVPGRPTVDDLVAMALRDVVAPEHKPASGASEDGLATVLARPGLRLGPGSGVDFSRLAERGCRRLKIGGSQVFEVCFQRVGVGMIHLYITSDKLFADFENPVESGGGEAGGRSVATWVEQGRRFVLVSSAGGAGIRNLL